jgi:hypothetical protein
MYDLYFVDFPVAHPSIKTEYVFLTIILCEMCQFIYWQYQRREIFERNISICLSFNELGKDFVNLV